MTATQNHTGSTRSEISRNIDWPIEVQQTFTTECLADTTLRAASWELEVQCRLYWSAARATTRCDLERCISAIGTAVDAVRSRVSGLAEHYSRLVTKIVSLHETMISEPSFIEHVADNPVTPEYDPKGRRVVILSPNEFDVTEDSLRAFSEYISHNPGTYAYGSRLARISNNSIRIMDQPAIREFITQSCHLRKYGVRNGSRVPIHLHPPTWLVHALDARLDWPNIPLLRGIMHHPVLLPTGNILQKHGYDPSSGLYLSFESPSLQLPDYPTQADAHASARTILAELCCNFPFEHQHHASAVLAAVLTPFARPAIDGPCPAFLIEASTPGSGKSLLAEAIGHVVLGKSIPPTPSVGTDDAEWRKTITASLKGGEPLAIIDNIRGSFGSQCLDMLFTCTEWDARILGVTERWRGPALKVWLLTSNNMTIVGDLARRIIPIRLNCTDEHPERRGGWRHPDLRAFIRSNRTFFSHHIMTILKSWHLTGMPSMGGEFFGMYENWCRIVRDAVIFCGWPDPCLGRNALYQHNSQELVSHGELLKAWHKTQQQMMSFVHSCGFSGSDDLKNIFDRIRRGIEGISAAEMLLLAHYQHIDGPMRQALLNLSSNGKMPSAQVLGSHLSTIRDRPINGLRLSARTVHGDNLWLVTSTKL